MAAPFEGGGDPFMSVGYISSSGPGSLRGGGGGSGSGGGVAPGGPQTFWDPGSAAGYGSGSGVAAGSSRGGGGDGSAAGGFSSHHPAFPGGSMGSMAAGAQIGGSMGVDDEFANEPPLLQELGVDFGHIRAKLLGVLNISKTIGAWDAAQRRSFHWLLGATSLAAS